ncbi:hypothetical protein AN401_07200 [Zobellella denitrificans]|uniref:Terminase n=1 Tax=Zobellella denitrificans TaxID=347534 RepID=A0A291HNI2_9GAMM|nr:DUF3486 family protein [Zobellella denitrificans]ATG73669.1 hypothetical protein AN401_07200 [Zobellella denitrificans]
MAPRSKVYSLPPELREQLNERLVNSGFAGYEALSAWLAESGHNISKSAVHRYGEDLREEFEEAMGDVRKTTELARAMAADDTDESGHLLDATARIVQDQLLRISIAMRKAEADPATAAKQLSSVTRALADIGRVSLGQKKWAREVRAEILAEQRAKLDAMPNQGGVTEETKQAIREALGIN